MPRRTLARFLLAASIPLSLLCPTDALAQDGDECGPAVVAATAHHHLPDGLLRAIAETESGRQDFASGRRVPWPWTVNAQGTGHFFASKTDAVAYVRELWASGITSIDVGCLQVNLHYHPTAFATLEQAFDPQANADYAATFLVALHGSATGWSAAVADYHSASPIEGGTYLRRVMVNLSGPPAIGRPVGLIDAALVTPVPAQFGMTIITPDTVGLSPRRHLPRVITP